MGWLQIQPRVSERRIPVVPATSIAEVLTRFKASRSWHTEKPFNCDTFERRSKEHTAANKIDAFFVRTGGNWSHSQSRQETAVIRDTPPFKDCTYFIDPGDKRVFCVTNEAVKQGFLQRGFKVWSVTHLSGMPATFPVLSTAAPSSMNPEELASKLGPLELILPSTYPKLWVPTKDGTTAEGIVHAFETKVYDPSARVAYSPYRLWTHDARKKANIKANTRLTKTCQCYWYLRVILKADPSTVKLSIGAKTAAAAKEIKARNVSAPDWFELATNACTTLQCTDLLQSTC